MLDPVIMCALGALAGLLLGGAAGALFVHRSRSSANAELEAMLLGTERTLRSEVLPVLERRADELRVQRQLAPRPSTVERRDLARESHKALVDHLARVAADITEMEERQSMALSETQQIPGTPRQSS